MRLALAVCLVGCTHSDPDVLVERQASTLDAASDAAWQLGGAVRVALPGTFEFPQPLALRISIVDSDMIDMVGAPKQLSIDSATLTSYGAANYEVAAPPSCAASFCMAELFIAEPGALMFIVSGRGDGATQQDCFYYGVIEDAADPQAAGAAMQAELEQDQADCRRSLRR